MLTSDEQIGVLGVALYLQTSSATELKDLILAAEKKWNRSSEAEQLILIERIKTLLNLCNAKVLREVARFDN